MVKFLNRKRKNIFNLKNGLVSISISVLLLLLIEVYCRTMVSNQFSTYQTNLSIQGKSRWINDSVLHWTNRPFYLEYNLSSQYNELGMRVYPKDVLMPKKVKDDFWVFLLGGSAMAGMGSNKNGKWYDITGVDDHTISESIDGYLKTYLQRNLPNKNVRVFNAAVSNHGISQSFNRYKTLEKYNPDWIISMDGVNEPSQLENNKEIDSYLRQNWENNPTQKMPLTRTFFMMSNSALYYKLAKFKYYFLNEKRKRQKLDSLDINRIYWSKIKSGPISFEIENQQLLQNALTTFKQELLNFDSYLNQKNQKHLLLIQPHLAFRDTNSLKMVEKSVFNYFSNYHDDSKRNTFLKGIYNFSGYTSHNIHSMEKMHSWKDWLFVDYCHFTKGANERIANEIGQYILSDAVYKPFTNF
jgi:hypothetical protein